MTRQGPTYEQITLAARAIHEANYLAHGDGYATPEEMETHRYDPLACNELVDDALAATFGFEDRFAMRDYTHSAAHARAHHAGMNGDQAETEGTKMTKQEKAARAKSKREASKAAKLEARRKRFLELTQAKLAYMKGRSAA